MEYIFFQLFFMFWNTGIICIIINYCMELEIALIPFFLMPCFQSNRNNQDGGNSHKFSFSCPCNQLKPTFSSSGRWERDYEALHLQFRLSSTLVPELLTYLLQLWYACRRHFYIYYKTYSAWRLLACFKVLSGRHGQIHKNENHHHQQIPTLSATKQECHRANKRPVAL